LNDGKFDDLTFVVLHVETSWQAKASVGKARCYQSLK